MSDLDATPDLSEVFCPTCEPSRDPLKGVAVLRYCYQHAPSAAGLDDERTGTPTHLSGTNDPDGYDCRAMARLISERR